MLTEFSIYINLNFVKTLATIPIDLTELKLSAFYDLKKWKKLELGQLGNEDILEELKKEKDIISDFLRKFIFDKYKHDTIHSTLRKTYNGYSFNRKFAKYLSMGCKRNWNIRINISDKSAYLDTRCSCSQFINSIKKSIK